MINAGRKEMVDAFNYTVAFGLLCYVCRCIMAL